MAGTSGQHAWTELMDLVERRWGGPQAFLANNAELFRSPKAGERRQDAAFDNLVEQTGGRFLVSQLLNVVADAGGVHYVLKALASVQLSQVCDFLEGLRSGGGQFQDLTKLTAIVGQVGGLTRLIRTLDKLQDPSRLTDIVRYGDAFARQGLLDSAEDTASHPAVLAKVLGDMDAESFLQAFDNVKLSSMAELVPLLISAGVLRGRGQHQTEEEVAAAGESALRWLARAGGAFLVSTAVYPIPARSFLKVMEQVNSCGLGRLRQPSLTKVGNWLTHLTRRLGSLEDFVDMVGKTDIISVVSCLNLTRSAVPSEHGEDFEDTITPIVSSAAQAFKTGSSIGGSEEPLVRVFPGPTTSEQAAPVHNMLQDILQIARATGMEGIFRLLSLFHKAESLERLERGVDLLGAARLLKTAPEAPPSQGQGSDIPGEDFEKGDRPEGGTTLASRAGPDLAVLDKVDYAGLAPSLYAYWSTALAVQTMFVNVWRLVAPGRATNIKLFEECLDVLHEAGLTQKSFKLDDRGPSAAQIESWRKVVAMLAANGGPDLFLDSLQGVAVEDFLHMIGLLRRAGLARSVDDTDQDMPSFCFGHDEDAGRIRNAMLHEFVERVVQAGGFHAFWHALKGVDLAKLKGDLHCLAVIRRKLSELTNKDWWLAVHDAEGLEDLLHSHLEERKRRGDDLTLRQRQRLVKRFKEVGGVESFLEKFDKVNLAQLLRQHEALDKARIKRVSVIEALAEIGWLVKHEVEHLEGLYTVAETLVRWGDRHFCGAEPSRLWRVLADQVAWLLSAIEENGTLLKATINHGSKNPAKEPELTPARLAQFLQALRPMGGVTGFLTAFRGLDFATAAVQARILHDSCVRSSETTRRLSCIYRLLHYNPAHLRGLEHFLRRFAGPVFAEAQAQGCTSQDRLRAAERWQRLTSFLAMAAGRTSGGADPEPGSGPERALEVLQLGLRLSQAAGLKVSAQEGKEPFYMRASIYDSSGVVAEVDKAIVVCVYPLHPAIADHACTDNKKAKAVKGSPRDRRSLAMAGNGHENSAADFVGERLPGTVFVAAKLQEILSTTGVWYGFNVSVQQILTMGAGSFIAALTMVFSTLAVGVAAGEVLRVDRSVSLLVATGASICGVSAVMAAAPVVEEDGASASKVSVALATVMVFGIASMFLYPIMWQRLPGPVSARAMGIYTGATVYEVAGVVAAGHAMSPTVASAALLTKLVRVLMLAPYLFIVSRLRSGHSGSTGIQTPWFAFAFFGVCVFSSYLPLPDGLAACAIKIGSWCTALAMVGLGLESDAAAIKRMGWRPMLLASALFAYLAPRLQTDQSGS
ncbi:unnamed protein product [Symbiodinium pilosum]|uniref:Uncharacterized protein n=1 Tax=Symbiodinium pilosum TaxID=2952 RepID=A0A812K416_SYMPI|nr:unnamed protein product [Symbiodinium pilosum]